jgi:hypothetical protein
MVFKEGEKPKLYNRGDGEFGTDISHIYFWPKTLC